MTPVLYSFRRCPYAMRARLALHSSGMAFELREVALRNKPASMLTASPKGSVPVLVLPDGGVIDESWEIMLWALRQHDPEGWLGKDEACIAAASPLIFDNDTNFKRDLDQYKYPERYPDNPQLHYRTQAEIFLRRLEDRLCATPYLLGDTLSIADASIFPFIRQFADVNKEWFVQAPYVSLQRWLNDFLDSARFAAVMYKHQPWQPGDTPIILNNEEVNQC
ncbi:MAG: glutathione S-transferase [Gallionella sp.]